MITNQVRNFAAFLAVTVLVCGCATNIMKSYVGQSVQQVMVDYGPPSSAFDMGDGTRAFQWVMTHTHRTPMTVSGTAWTSGPYSSQLTLRNATVTGGQTYESECVYTMYGRWDEGGQRWLIASFEKPRFVCE